LNYEIKDYKDDKEIVDNEEIVLDKEIVDNEEIVLDKDRIDILLLIYE
jgi:hypothetical protein